MCMRRRTTLVSLVAGCAVVVGVAWLVVRGGAQEARWPAVAASTPGVPPHAALRPGSAAAAARAAAFAIHAKKRELAARCWTPLVLEHPEPSSSRHVLRETFDPDGSEIRRVIVDVPEGSRADVKACLRALPLDLSIEAPGQPTTVSVTLAFP